MPKIVYVLAAVLLAIGLGNYLFADQLKMLAESQYSGAALFIGLIALIIFAESNSAKHEGNPWKDI